MPSLRHALSVPLLVSLLVAISSCGGVPEPKSAEYRFDAAGQIESIFTPDGNRLRYRWNAAGYLSELRYRGGRVLYAYDPAGMLGRVEDRNGSVEYYRDALGRVTDVLWQRAFTRLVRYQRDARNNIIGVSVHDVDRATAAGAVSGLDVSDSFPDDEESWRQRRQHVFALSDSLSKADAFTEYKARYEYDDLGRLIAVEGPGGRVTNAHSAASGTMERRWPNGMTTVQTVDPQGRVRAVEHRNAAGATLAAFRYRWGESGELAEVAESGIGGERRVTLRWQDGALAGVETSGDQPAAVRYDATGKVATATNGSRAIEFGYDELGQLRRSGDASWELDENGWPESLSVKGSTLKVDYDGRGLPTAIDDGETTVKSEFDAKGHLAGVRVDGDGRHFLPDPVTEDDAPLVAWDGTGRVVASQLYGDGLLMELDAAGRPRYFLRDGLGAVRLVVGGDGTMEAGGSPWPGVAATAAASVARAAPDRRGLPFPSLSMTLHAAQAEEVPADPWSLRNVDAASRWARFLTEEQYFRRAGLDTDEVQGRLYNDRIQGRYEQFLSATDKRSVDVYLKGISNGWAETTVDSRARCAAGDCLFLPTFGTLPKQLHLPATFVEKLGRRLMTRKLDMPALIESARQAGKTLNSIVCESGCGFELERNIRDLERYARRNPGTRLPVIVVQSTDIGQLLRDRLEAAGYPVALVTENGIVPRVVASSADYAGVLGRIPILGEDVGLPVQIISALGFVGKQLATGQPVVGPHGVDAHWDEIQVPLDAHRLPMRALRDETPDELADLLNPGSASALGRERDPFPGLERRLGGIALGARAETEIDVGSIAGLARDRNGVAFVIGKRKVGIPALKLADLAVALRLAYGTPPLFPRFSLDPADPANPQGEWLKLVHLPDSLAGTGFGRTMFLADWIMKQLSFGLFVDPSGAVTRRAVMPAGLRDVFSLTFDQQGGTSGEEVWARLWIVARDFRWKIANDAVAFTSARMGVNAKRQVIDPRSKTGLSDVETGLDPATAQFAADLTNKFDAVGGTVPEFARLTELAKVVALAHWMRARGVPVDEGWLRRQSDGGTGGMERVSALTDSRSEVRTTSSRAAGVVTVSTHTRTLRMFGGVDLTVFPTADGDAGSLADTIGGVDASQSLRQFPVSYDGEPYVATVLPINDRGRTMWQNGRALDGAKREYSPDGAVTRVIDQDGSSIDYQYSGGRTVAATENVAGRPVATHQLDVDGRIERSDDLEGGRVEYEYGPDNKIRKATQTTASGHQETWETTPDGVTRTSTAPGYEPVVFRYEPDGGLSETDVKGTRSSRYPTSPQPLPSSPAPPAGNNPAPTTPVGSTPSRRSGSSTVVVRKKRSNWINRLFGSRGERFEVASTPPATRSVPSDPVDARRAEEARANSTADTTVMHVGRSSADGRVQVQFGSEQLSLERADLDTFLEGGPSPVALDAAVRRQADAGVSRLIVLDSTELFAGTSGSSGEVDAVALVREMNREHGHELVIRLGTDTRLGVANAARIMSVTGPEDIAVVQAPESFNVTDFGVINDIRPALMADGIEVSEGITVSQRGNVMFFVGHKDAALKEYLDTMGKAQVLRDKFVVLCSCGAQGDVAFNSHLIREHGAIAVHSFPDNVNAIAAGDLLVSVGKEAKKPSRGPRPLDRLLRDAVPGARDPNRPGLWEEILKFLRGITQVSDLGFGHGTPQHA